MIILVLQTSHIKQNIYIYIFILKYIDGMDRKLKQHEKGEGSSSNVQSQQILLGVIKENEEKEKVKEIERKEVKKIEKAKKAMESAIVNYSKKSTKRKKKDSWYIAGNAKVENKAVRRKGGPSIKRPNPLLQGNKYIFTKVYIE